MYFSRLLYIICTSISSETYNNKNYSKKFAYFCPTLVNVKKALFYEKADEKTKLSVSLLNMYMELG